MTTDSTSSQSETGTYRKPIDAMDKVDLVRRKSPISYREMMRQTSVYSGDEIFDALKWAESEGLVSRRDGDLETDGTTEELWVWERDDERL